VVKPDSRGAAMEGMQKIRTRKGRKQKMGAPKRSHLHR
jgi:hypothetical protein